MEDFFCSARLAFCLRSRNFYTVFGVVLVRDTNILSARARDCPRFVELFHKECYRLVRCCLPAYCPSFSLVPNFSLGILGFALVSVYFSI